MKRYLILLVITLALCGCTPDMEVRIFNNTNDPIKLISGCGTIEIKNQREGKFEYFCSINRNFEIISENNHWEYSREKFISKSYYSHTPSKDNFIRLKRFSFSPKYYIKLQLEKNGEIYSIPLKEHAPISTETPQLEGFPVFPIKKLTNILSGKRVGPNYANKCIDKVKHI